MIKNNQIYEALEMHQISEKWDMQDAARVLQRWTELFIFHFKLEIPTIALNLDFLRGSTHGHFRYGHNGFGLRREVAINRVHLQTEPFWDVLGTLLHELLHAWQELHGKPGKGNYHNIQFQKKAASLGLIVDSRGRQHYTPKKESRFLQLLDREGIEIPQIPELNLRRKRKGNSTLSKWNCACCNVRVGGRRELNARCLDCGQLFVRADITEEPPAQKQLLEHQTAEKPVKPTGRLISQLYSELGSKYGGQADPNRWWPIYFRQSNPPEFERAITNILVTQTKGESQSCRWTACRRRLAHSSQSGYSSS